MMSPNQRRNTIIAFAVILLLIFLWLLSFLLPHPKAKPVVQPIIAPPAVTTPTASPYTTEQLQQEKQTRTQSAGIIATSKLFVERFGSYSNEADFQNIRDVIPLMSQAFGAATTADLATKKQPTGFYGITTRVITVKVVSQDEKAGTATIDLSTQRVEENGSAQNTKTKYQDVELTFVKESGVWKIDSATWR